MKCPRCQQETPSDAEFCPECGAKLAALCSLCGTANAPGHKFCKRCGQSLPTTPVQDPSATRFASPESYTPKPLAERMLTSRDALEGERKHITVLFADLKGSMALVADRDPEEARKLLDPVLELMMEAVHRYEGLVNQVMGDGIMALFGAPLAHEDHAVRACYAALRMQDSLKRYAEGVPRTEGIPIQIRVGLNSGEVVVRSIGSDLHMDYTAVGQTTHLAARMEQLATPGSILLTRETLRLAEGFVHVTSRGFRSIKGVAHPLEVFELDIAPPTRRRFKAAAARGLTRFVGRDAEMGELDGVLERTRSGRGQVAAIVGAPGVGKSRFVWEFVHSHHTEGCFVLETGSVSYGMATPYLPIMDLLKAYFRLEEGDDHLEIQRKVIGKLLALDRSLAPTLPAFLALLDIPVDDSQWKTLDPPQRRQQTLAAITRLLLLESRRQPLVLVFEDLHWIDSETQAVLDSLVESVPSARILLLINYRPEYQHAWGNKSYYTQLPIDPLPPASAEEFLQALLGADPELQRLRELLIDRTDGNPFFLEESLWMLVETEVLVGERGAYRLAKALPAIQVPGTVQAVLAARIDRLPAEEKQLLQSAAVVGKHVPRALLQAVAELPGTILRRGLTHLQAAEFLYETSCFADLEYTFKHALTHEVAYGSILQERRRVLHARIVEALEGLYPDRLAEHIDSLADHAFRGRVWDKAVAYLWRSGATAFSRSANRAAVACFEDALTALRHLPESRERIDQAIDLRFDLRRALTPLGEAQRTLDHLRAAEVLAARVGDSGRLARITSFVTNSLYLMGDYHSAVTSGEQALIMAESLGDFTSAIATRMYLGRTWHALGDYHRAAEILRCVVTSLTGGRERHQLDLPVLPSVFSRSLLALCLTELGDFAEGLTHGYEAVRLAESVDHPETLNHAETLMWGYFGVGSVHLGTAEIPRALDMLEQAFALSKAKELAVFVPITGAALGYAYVLSGRLAEGLSFLERAAREAAAKPQVNDCWKIVTRLGEGYLRAERLEEAERVAEQALRLSREGMERGNEAHALRLLGDIVSRRDAVQAEAYYREAHDLAREIGMRPLLARCQLGLGRLHGNRGDHSQAANEFDSAISLFRALDMTHWLAQAEQELTALR